MAATATAPHSAVVAERFAGGVRVTVAGQPFANYLVDAGPQPAVWPIYGPAGQRLTRDYPLGERGADERDDHPHHVSLWFSHGAVRLGDGATHDFWHITAEHPTGARIEHREFSRLENGPAGAIVESKNDWMAGDQRLLADRRTLVFGASQGDDTAQAEAIRWIDATLRLTASEGPVTFGDTKEGSFGVRVAGTMKVDAGLGGRILNSRGQRDGDAWGRPASWVDYCGPVSSAEPDRLGGVTILSHPDSFRPQCLWHVRGYGLFAANPFGAKDFPPSKPPQGGFTLERDETLTLRYRVVLHNGAADPGTIDGWYAAFATAPSGPETNPSPSH